MTINPIKKIIVIVLFINMIYAKVSIPADPFNILFTEKKNNGKRRIPRFIDDTATILIE